jgi:hypothetical protein
LGDVVGKGAWSNKLHGNKGAREWPGEERGVGKVR